MFSLERLLKKNWVWKLTKLTPSVVINWQKKKQFCQLRIYWELLLYLFIPLKLLSYKLTSVTTETVYFLQPTICMIRFLVLSFPISSLAPVILYMWSNFMRMHIDKKLCHFFMVNLSSLLTLIFIKIAWIFSIC